MNFLIRLIIGPVLLVVFTAFGVLMTIYAGLGWMFTGSAYVKIVWPRWK